ncbi:MAG: nucleoside deaminase [Desulfobacterales bacterium]|nr:tRNA adenosine(34) deaminase TadA [Deltaproteobacteria bacterium]MBT8362829.1 tRNA adenosine(34) deaminase TadA [Deltaproteobacteria bacterium]NNK96429.1 nucleoside deaminase [Desulfobacterales bacterium]
MDFHDSDKIWMQQALNEARKSADFGEVPVGAIITDGSELLAAAGNCPITSLDPTAHAEINVIREAALKRNNYRLSGATLYVTLEPCIMCMGAIIHARIQRLVFGAYDPKTGAAVSRYQIGSDSLLNHSLIIQGGLLHEQCSGLLRTFFKQRRS